MTATPEASESGMRPVVWQPAVMTARLADGNGNTPRRTIRIPDLEWEAAKAAADANDDNLSEVIRAALKRYVARSTRQERQSAAKGDAQP